MAIGNAIVQTAKFKPLSYQEWAAPLQALNTQHAATEEALWELQDKAAEYEQYLINNPDSPLTQKYNAYINDIDRLSEQLAVNGISPQTRTDLLNLRRSYSDVVKPIKTGLAAYQKAVTKRTKDYNKGIIGPDITPETYIHNPSYIDNYVTAEDLYRNASQYFKNLKGFSSTPYIETLEDGTKVRVTPQGYGYQDFINAFEGNEAPQEIVDAINTLRNQYMGYAGEDKNTKNYIESIIRQAAGSAITQPKYNEVSTKKTNTKTTTISNSLPKGYYTDDSGNIYKDIDGITYTFVPNEDGSYSRKVASEKTVNGIKYVQKYGGRAGQLVQEGTNTEEQPIINAYGIYADTRGKNSYSRLDMIPEIVQNSNGSYSRADSPNQPLETITYSDIDNSDFGSKTRVEIKNLINTNFSDVEVKNREKELLILKEYIDKGKYNIYVIRKNPKYNPQLKSQNTEVQKVEAPRPLK